ncbi:hypothetical protein SAY87_008588 [Trapa incisa]|uniref:Uncharacterized protein n=1 Tax=Trapa incisa TaxID=236973 RepID=A0AAN7PW13_9MYRT|nr:hypothetical protein SAY87_008588 [Trapa incisa]
METSYAIANRAYKAGRKLVSESSDEGFLVKMLFSLTKLSSRMSFLASEQVNLLCSFLGDGKSLPLQKTSLRCLNYMARRVACDFFEHGSVSMLIIIVDHPGLPTEFQCEAVVILHQVPSKS